MTCERRQLPGHHLPWLHQLYQKQVVLQHLLQEHCRNRYSVQTQHAHASTFMHIVISCSSLQQSSVRAHVCSKFLRLVEWSLLSCNKVGPVTSCPKCLEPLKHCVHTAFSPMILIATHRACLNRRQVPDCPCSLACAATTSQHAALGRACWRQT